MCTRMESRCYLYKGVCRVERFVEANDMQMMSPRLSDLSVSLDGIKRDVRNIWRFVVLKVGDRTDQKQETERWRTNVTVNHIVFSFNHPLENLFMIDKNPTLNLKKKENNSYGNNKFNSLFSFSNSDDIFTLVLQSTRLEFTFFYIHDCCHSSFFQQNIRIKGTW